MRTVDRVGTASDMIVPLEQIAIGAVAITARALAMAAGELTLLQWRVLVIAGDAPTGAYVGEIGRRIGISPPSATRVIQRMERQGLVELDRDDTDRRHVRVRLSADGRRIRDAVMRERRSRIAALLGDAGVVADAADTVLLQAIADALVADG